jgi:hypothetical protein
VNICLAVSKNRKKTSVPAHLDDSGMLGQEQQLRHASTVHADQNVGRHVRLELSRRV